MVSEVKSIYKSLWSNKYIEVSIYICYEFTVDKNALDYPNQICMILGQEKSPLRNLFLNKLNFIFPSNKSHILVLLT